MSDPNTPAGPASSEIEQALFRAMQLPTGNVLYQKPPREAVTALTALQQTQKDAALYSLRAREWKSARSPTTRS